jgi:dTDP-4-dehydrorhamnose 3,5-epimerase
MEITSNFFGDVLLLAPKRHVDARGFFSETFSKRTYESLGITADFVQDNHSLSRERGVVRGLHFQIPPHAQAKLLRVLRGAIIDVVVDIRVGSPSYGKFATAEMSAQNWSQIYIPPGFAHGFCTLEPDTEILYKVDNYYAPSHERGLRWNDPAVGIPWPVDEADAILSERDRTHPLLAQLPPCFTYAENGANTALAGIRTV